nr:hypothetical protein [Tanacetum cinerariifolium]
MMEDMCHLDKEEERLLVKASADESRLWHRRLGHLNFKTMNKLVRNNLVKGLPSKCFENDHTCVACLKGKQHKASCKTKFTWTFFLRTKDETSGIFRNFITEIENLKDLKVKIIRTPLQNGVAERRNKTLIEAARTMLADAKLPVTFWAKAVNTACYVQNSVLVNKSQNKTPYELFNSRTPTIRFLRPFGCHVMILNTLDHLGKFDAKGDEDFLENKLIKKGAGPNWLFDIDTLTNFMIYVPVVVAGTSSTNISDISPETSSDSRLISKGVLSQEETPSLDNALTLSNRFEDTIGVEADLSNTESNIPASPTPTFRIHKDHPKSQIIGPADTREEPKKIFDALKDPSQVEAMQEELLQFKIQNVWILVDCPKGIRPIGTKWVLENKKDERGIMIRNKAKLMDVKSAFLYGTIDEEVYVMQPPGFQDRAFPDRVYKVEKEMYELHQAPRAWYGTLSKYLLDNGFQRGTIDQTLFIRKHKDGIFLSQDKYVGDILKKFRYSDVRSANTPMDKENLWGKDGLGKDVELLLYRSMIGSLMYLTASIPDIMFDVCACARHQVTPKECHLHAVKRIFRYLKGHPKLGLWYPKESPFDLVVYPDSDYGGATQDRKSTTGGCQFLGRRLISWQCKKQTIVATSTTEAEYVAAASGCGQVL